MSFYPQFMFNLRRSQFVQASCCPPGIALCSINSGSGVCWRFTQVIQVLLWGISRLQGVGHGCAPPAVSMLVKAPSLLSVPAMKECGQLSHVIGITEEFSR